MIRLCDVFPEVVLRWLALLGVALSVLGGCGGEPVAGPTVEPTPTQAPLPLAASVPARIRARGHLIVGLRYDLPPFGYVTEEGTLAGFDVDLGRELAHRWLGDAEAVAFSQVRTDTAVQHIQAGDVDLVPTALLHAQDLEEQLDFSLPLFEDGYALLVRSEDSEAIRGPADLEGRPVGVLAWSEAELALEAAVPFTVTVVPYADLSSGVNALSQGEIDALTGLRRRLVRGLRDVPNTAIVGQYSQAFLAPAHATNEPGLADLLALTLQEMFVDGTFAQLYERWFPGDAVLRPEIWPGTATMTLEEAGVVVNSPDTIAAIRARGRLQVAMIQRVPFAYLDGEGNPAGYEVHLIRMMADRWLGDRTAVDFTPVSSQEALAMLGAGTADILIGAVEHSREAERVADFGLTTYVGGESLMVRAGAVPEGIGGLAGQTVAAVSGTESNRVMQRVVGEAGVSLVVLPKATLEEAIAALQAGEVVAVVGERVELLGPAIATPGIGVTADRFTQVPLALALPPGDSAFRDLVNLTLQQMAEEGLYQAIYAEWFDDDAPSPPPWPGEPVRPLRIVLTP